MRGTPTLTRLAARTHLIGADYYYLRRPQEWHTLAGIAHEAAHRLRDTAAEGYALMHEGQLASTEVTFTDALRIRQAVRDTTGIAWALLALGLVRTQQDPSAALPVLTQATQAFAAAPDPWAHGVALTCLSIAHRDQGAFDQAVVAARQAVDLLDCVGDRVRAACARAVLAEASAPASHRVRCPLAVAPVHGEADSAFRSQPGPTAADLPGARPDRKATGNTLAAPVQPNSLLVRP